MAAPVKLPAPTLDGNGGKVYMCRDKEQALAVLRLARVRAHFRVWSNIDAQLPDTPDQYIPGAFRGSLAVSRDAAVMFVADVFHDRLSERGAALQVRISEGSRRSKWCHKARTLVEYGAPSVFVYIG